MQANAPPGSAPAADARRRFDPRKSTLLPLILVLLVGGVGMIALLGTQRIGHNATWLLSRARSVGQLGWVAAVLVQTLVAGSGILPASITGVVSGAVYGVVAGFVVAALATLAGGTFAFVLSRSLLRPWVVCWIGRRQWLEQVDRAVGQDGWRIVCLLRMSPLMP